MKHQFSLWTTRWKLKLIFETTRYPSPAFLLCPASGILVRVGRRLSVVLSPLAVSLEPCPSSILPYSCILTSLFSLLFSDSLVHSEFPSRSLADLREHAILKEQIVNESVRTEGIGPSLNHHTLLHKKRLPVRVPVWITVAVEGRAIGWTVRWIGIKIPLNPFLKPGIDILRLPTSRKHFDGGISFCYHLRTASDSTLSGIDELKTEKEAKHQSEKYFSHWDSSRSSHCNLTYVDKNRLLISVKSRIFTAEARRAQRTFCLSWGSDKQKYPGLNLSSLSAPPGGHLPIDEKPILPLCALSGSAVNLILRKIVTPAQPANVTFFPNTVTLEGFCK